jgi:hypothetical protein
MAAGKGSKIEVGDYTTIYNTILPVLGLGSGTTAATATGYGIKPLSTGSLETVGQYKNITSAQWTNLRSDILAARQHQVGTTPVQVLTDPTQITQITEADRAAYLAMAQAASDVGNRFLMGAGQSGTTNLLNPTGSTSFGVRSTAWNGVISHTVTMTFAPTTAQQSDFPGITGQDVARFFFNTGGYIRFSAGRYDDYPTNTQNGTLGSKNLSWNILLKNMGNITYTYNNSTASPGQGVFAAPLGYYPQLQSLGTQYSFYSTALAGSDLYSPNQYDIKSKITNSGNNQIIEFVITFRDLSTGVSEAASGAAPSFAGHTANTAWAIDENVTGTLYSKVEAVYALNGGVAVTLPTVTSTTL